MNVKEKGLRISGMLTIFHSTFDPIIYLICMQTFSKISGFDPVLNVFACGVQESHFLQIVYILPPSHHLSHKISILFEILCSPIEALKHIIIQYALRCQQQPIPDELLLSSPPSRRWWYTGAGIPQPVSSTSSSAVAFQPSFDDQTEKQ